MSDRRLQPRTSSNAELEIAEVRHFHRSRMRPDERRALAFVALADGEGLILAADVAGEVGWEPRAAGAKLRSLYLRGYLTYEAVPGARLNGWALTDLGRRVA